MNDTLENHNTQPACIPKWLVLLMASAVGIIVANLYYAQTLVGPIAEALGMHEKAAGMIVTMTQIGYVIGLIFIVPLADLFENRKLIITISILGIVALLAAGLGNDPLVFLAASTLIGIGSVAVQIIVPYAAHLASDKNRGRVMGRLMSGLFLGIMLSRPIASFVAEISSWHVIFLLSAAVMGAVVVTLSLVLPRRVPDVHAGYRSLMKSMIHLVVQEPLLRRRAFYQAAMFGTFCLFWTAVPLLLTSPAYRFSHGDVALFALVGVTGAIAAPIAGHFADKGYATLMTGTAISLAALSLLVSLLGPAGSHYSVAALLVAAIVLDFGAAMNLVTSQHKIFAINPEQRSRINGIFMAIFFVGGAFGSALGGWAYVDGGWMHVVLTGLFMPVLAFAYYLTEFKTKKVATA